MEDTRTTAHIRIHSQRSWLLLIMAMPKVLYVPHTPLFIHGTLYENLTYGVAGLLGWQKFHEGWSEGKGKIDPLGF